MADKTTNYNLVKPLKSETIKVEDLNHNMDIIDNLIKEMSEINSIETISSREIDDLF